MRRLIALLTTSLLALGLLGGVALANGDDHEHPPEHPHALLIGFEVVDDNGTADPSDDVVTFDRCVDLADNREVRLTAHHHSLHTGTAGFGDPSVGITRAGHIVIPLAPYPGSPFADCDDVVAFLTS